MGTKERRRQSPSERPTAHRKAAANVAEDRSRTGSHWSGEVRTSPQCHTGSRWGSLPATTRARTHMPAAPEPPPAASGERRWESVTPSKGPSLL